MRRLAASTGLVAALISITIWRTEPILGRDDWLLRSLAEGSYTGEPTERLIFMNSLLGQVLKALYRMAPDVPWYGLMLYVLTGAALSVVVWLISEEPPWTWLVAAALLAYFGPPLILVAAWTETALILVAAGALLVVRSRPIPGAVFIGLGFLVRTESVGLLLLVAPLFLVHWRNRRILLVGALAAGAIMVAGFGYEKLHYRQGEWREFAEFNAVRGQLHGTARARPDAALQAELGWDSTDTLLFQAFLPLDPDAHSTERLSELLDRTRWLRTDASPTDGFDRNRTGLILIGLTVAALGAWRWAPTLLWALGGFYVMEVTFRSRARIELVVLLTIAIAMLLLAKGRPRFWWLFAAGALWFAFLQAPDQLRSNNERNRPSEPGITYIDVGSRMFFNVDHPLSDGRESANTLSTGWTVRSPHFERHLELHGMDDLVTGMLRSDVRVLGRDVHVQAMVAYLERTTDLEAHAVHVRDAFPGIGEWAVVGTSPRSTHHRTADSTEERPDHSS